MVNCFYVPVTLMVALPAFGTAMSKADSYNLLF
jgi:hypothetical protein